MKVEDFPELRRKAVRYQQQSWKLPASVSWMVRYRPDLNAEYG
jgi:hypothetical protein